MPINAHCQFAVQSIDRGAGGAAAQWIQRGGTAARAVHRQQGVHAGDMVAVIDVAGDAIDARGFEVIEIDYCPFHAGGDGDGA
ncbi:hypothetical protein D3C81_1645290 [compost metagenome]